MPIMLQYHAAYYKQDDGWYVVSILDFPGVHSQGKNLREARLMIKDALKLTIEYYLDEGLKLPKPKAKSVDASATKVEKIRLEVLLRDPVPS
jgi:predicted RNase H-like HicB family nuclease